MREKLIEVKRILGMCVKQGILSECKGCPYSKSNSSCMDALMEDALTVINHLERKDSAQKWIPVSERLPEEMDWVLCGCVDGEIHILRYDYLMDDWDIHNRPNSCYGKGFVTHWMPMPQPPKGE
jgi:hypothetical protein